MADFFADAATPRLARGLQLIALETQMDQIIQLLGETRNQYLAARTEIITNADGDFEPQDRGAIEAKIGQLKGKLNALANSFSFPP